MKKKAKQKPLIDKHKLFCHAYLSNGCNGTAAYKEVYKESNEDNARFSASRLLTNGNIRQYIDTLLLNVFSDKSGIASVVIERLMGIVGTNIKEVCFWNGTALELVESNKLSSRQASSIKEISQKITSNDEYGMSVKQWNPLKAAELLMKYCGMLQDKVDLTSGGQAIQPVFNYIFPEGEKK